MTEIFILGELYVLDSETDSKWPSSSRATGIMTAALALTFLPVLRVIVFELIRPLLWWATDDND